MATYPGDYLYSRQHEWIRLEEEHAVLGITDFAQSELGDVVFVELPEPGEVFDADDEIGTIESVKAVSDLYAPISGEVVEVNAELANHPEHVNEDCYGDGWMVVIAPNDPTDAKSLLGAAEYRKHVEDRSPE